MAVLWFTRSQLHGEVASIVAAAVVLLLYWKVEAVCLSQSGVSACSGAHEVLATHADPKSKLARLRWHSLLLAALRMFPCFALQVQFYARAFLPLKHRCGQRQAVSRAGSAACSLTFWWAGIACRGLNVLC